MGFNFINGIFINFNIMETIEPINYRINFSKEDIYHAYYSDFIERFFDDKYSEKKDEIEKLARDFLDENTEFSEK